MGLTIGLIIGGVAALLILVMLIAGIKIVPQTKVIIIERLGSFHRILHNGVSFIFPFIDKVVISESLKERVLDFPAQDVITKDNVTMKIDTVLYMQITDPKLFAYGVSNPLFAIENLTATTLRNLVGDLELDQTLTSRDTINERLRSILDEATDPWGIKILRVELKNILPPLDIRRAMEKQMRAEREKREKILIAEGGKLAAILEAEGQKRSNILNAEGRKEAAILIAEGRKKSIELINASSPTEQTIKLRSFDALKTVSEGKATTLIIPSDLTNMASIASIFAKSAKAVTKDVVETNVDKEQ